MGTNEDGDVNIEVDRASFEELWKALNIPNFPDGIYITSPQGDSKIHIEVWDITLIGDVNNED